MFLSSRYTRGPLIVALLFALGPKYLKVKNFVNAVAEGEFCSSFNTGFKGTQAQTLEQIPTKESCQEMCRLTTQCLFFSYVEITHKCLLYEEILAIKDSAGVVSGPKYCYEGQKQQENKTKKPEINAANAGQLVTPVELISLINTEQAQKIELNSQKIEDSVAVASPAAFQAGAGSVGIGPRTQSGNILGGLLSNVFGGNLLGGVTSIFNNGATAGGSSKLLEGTHEALSTGITSAETFLSAGNTFLKTFPISDFIQAGADLIANVNPSLLKDGVQGGVSPTAKNKETAAAPPKGVGAPEVTCLSEGMKCCVPRAAVPRYQTNPPKLNGVNKPQCKGTYSSATDQLCVTTKYADDVCQTVTLETSELYVYRNIMELPVKTMNNAICECVITKRNVDSDELSYQLDMSVPSISGTGQWQYSLNAQDAERQSNLRIIQALDRFENGTAIAAKMAQVYAKNIASQGIESSALTGQTAKEILDVLDDFNKGVKSVVQAAM